MFWGYRTVALLLLLSVVAVGQIRPLNEDAVRYLEFLREEQQELEFQLEREEITPELYRRANARIKILKTLVSSYGRSDRPLPEFYVVTAEEVENLVEGGLQKLKHARPGQSLDGSWRYIKRIYREGVLFYVLERRVEEIK